MQGRHERRHLRQRFNPSSGSFHPGVQTSGGNISEADMVCNGAGKDWLLGFKFFEEVLLNQEGKQ
jgi:hypothetical protein